jgi:hypothetical protein
MSYTLGQAAKATGMSKSTILRAIKSSRISATKNEASGDWQIDPAELHRVYPSVAEKGNAQNGGGTDGKRFPELLQGWERERVLLERTIDDLRNRLDASEEERRTTLRQLTAILTDQRAQAMITPPPDEPAAARATEAPASTRARSWWRFGKR